MFWEFLETENGLATNLVDGKWGVLVVLVGIFLGENFLVTPIFLADRRFWRSREIFEVALKKISSRSSVCVP